MTSGKPRKKKSDKTVGVMAEVIPEHSKIHVASLNQLPLAEWNALYAEFRENSSIASVVWGGVGLD
jgi:hypothetical protein